MEKFVYPLLYYQLPDKKVLGILVGSYHQVVDKDLKNVKSTLTTYLKREYKKFDDYPYTPFENFRMKTFEIKTRPVYREQNKSYPSGKVVKVPVEAIYGPTDQGHYCCFLPTLNENFYYYDPKLLPSLVQNFSSNILNQKKPDEIYRIITGLRPQLSEISLRININREYNFNNGWSQKERFKELRALAEQYPQNKSIRKNLTAFPEAAWELENEVETTIENIVSNRANILLVGNHGTGKSSVLSQAIRKISAKSSKLNITFWQLMSQRITARTKYLGEWQQNVEELIDELDYANGILWIVDMLQLLQTGGEGPEDSVAAFLSSFLQSGKLQLVGEVTPSQLDSMRRMLPGFVENFQLIEIHELPEHKIHSILDKFADYCSKNIKVDINKKAIELCYRLLLRYYPYESFPGKAVRFLSQSVNKALLHSHKTIDNNDIINNFVEQTGMPELFLRDDMLLNDVKLKKYFTDKIIGQNTAIESLTNVVKVFKAGLNSPVKPITTMIFAGPTGVGKTASTRALADYFFGKGSKKSPLVRIDMSEFQHPSHLSRFIGVGGEVGKLVQEIRERPFSVLLLDEIEKAHPSVFDALLTVLDEGILVDSFGRITNFRNTIIIMTTNLGSSNRASVGFGDGNLSNYESVIGKFFRPEFVNRIDNIVIFNSLEYEHIRGITRLELKAVNDREGFLKRNIKISFSSTLEEYISNTGFDKRYGARPLQRVIENEIIAPLAKFLLHNANITNCTLCLDIVNDVLKITKADS
jgi:ATP-dependent Clp protease ATP-binding subunit ClpC